MGGGKDKGQFFNILSKNKSMLCNVSSKYVKESQRLFFNMCYNNVMAQIARQKAHYWKVLVPIPGRERKK